MPTVARAKVATGRSRNQSVTITEPSILLGQTTCEELAPVGTTLRRKAVDIQDYARTLGQRVPLDTGILPPGLLTMRQAGDEQQIVVQTPPGIYPINWAAHEGNKHTVYQLAQPWKIAVGVFVDGEFVGARIFYSPVRITTLHQPLYHTNLPNVNCFGYGITGYGSGKGGYPGGVGVGWVCLYHRGSTATMDLGAKAHYLLERVSGQEGFNDGNMSETDGTRFYRLAEKPAYMHQRTNWEKKTQRDGVAWTLEEGVWLPVLVESIDKQEYHVEGGIPLTLDMVLRGRSKFYYNDGNVPHLSNELSTEAIDSQTREAQKTKHTIDTKVSQRIFQAAFHTIASAHRIMRSERPYSQQSGQ